MAAIPPPTLTMGASPRVRLSIVPGANGLKQPKLARNVTDQVVAIFYEGTGYRLRRPITLTTHREHGYWIHEYAPLGIAAYGRTKVESLEAFALEFSSAWHWIGKENDYRLDSDAQQLKRRLQRTIAEVKPIDEVLSEFNFKEAHQESATARRDSRQTTPTTKCSGSSQTARSEPSEQG
jgi:hypothetical protein